MDLIGAFGNLEAMVKNIIDKTVARTTYRILFLLRFNKLIERTIIIVKKEVANSKFKNAK